MHNILPVLKGQAWLANKLIQQARIFSDTDVSRAFNRLLHYPDNDLWDFVTGKQPPPDAESARIIGLFD
jgi:succinate dehydrogenase flavin-adding protein (antitoxin of CptAB toxin-antitoxin module)